MFMYLFQRSTLLLGLLYCLPPSLKGKVCKMVPAVNPAKSGGGGEKTPQYIYIYIYIYIYLYACIYIYVYVCVICTQTHEGHVCMYLCMYIGILYVCVRAAVIFILLLSLLLLFSLSLSRLSLCLWKTTPAGLLFFVILFPRHKPADVSRMCSLVLHLAFAQSYLQLVPVSLKFLPKTSYHTTSF